MTKLKEIQELLINTLEEIELQEKDNSNGKWNKARSKRIRASLTNIKKLVTPTKQELIAQDK